MNNIGNNTLRVKVIWSIIVPQIILLTISIVWILIDSSANVLPYFKALNLIQILIGLLVGIVLSFGGYVIYKIALKTKFLFEVVELFERMIAPSIKTLRITDMIILSLISSVVEETFFRGILFMKFGIVLSSLCFGVMHLPGVKYWIYAAWATMSGAIFCLLFSWSGSLVLPILIHATNNIIGMLLLVRLKDSS